MEPSFESLANSIDLSPYNSQYSGSQDSSSQESNSTEDSPAPCQHRSTWTRTKRCWICDKHLTKLLGRRRHHCRWCGRTVCKKHALNRRLPEGQTKSLRICDVCHKVLVNQSHNAGLLSEMAALRAEFDQTAKAIYERKLQVAELGKDVERLKFDLSSKEIAAKDSKAHLEGRLKDEVARLLSNQARYSSLEAAVQDTADSLTLSQQRLATKQVEAATCRSDVAHLLEQQRIMRIDVEKGVKSMQERVHIAQITKLLCELCRTRLYNSTLSEPSNEASQAQRVRSQSMVDRKVCADCALM